LVTGERQIEMLQKLDALEARVGGIGCKSELDVELGRDADERLTTALRAC